jgi:SET domain-containing protein
MLYLKKSLIPGAGKGLFVKNEVKRGEIVCEYEGEIVPWSVCEKRAEEGHEGYAFFITKNRCVDAYFTKEAIGRYANDAKGIGRVEGLRNNAQYEIKTRQGEKRVFIVATRTIKANDEVFVDYGKDYWKNLSKAKDLEKKVNAEQLKSKKKSVKKKQLT